MALECERLLGRAVPARVAWRYGSVYACGGAKVDELPRLSALAPLEAHQVGRLEIAVHPAGAVHARDALEHALRRAEQAQLRELLGKKNSILKYGENGV